MPLPFTILLVVSLWHANAAPAQDGAGAGAEESTGDETGSQNESDEEQRLTDTEQIGEQGSSTDMFLNPGASGFLHTWSTDFGQAFVNQFDVIEVNLFSPKLRVYLFDIGDDDEGELDVFDDGSAVPVINIIEGNFLNTIGGGKYGKDGQSQGSGRLLVDGGQATGIKPGTLLWGLNAGFGISAPATVTPDSTGMTTENDPNAPVILVSGGLVMQYRAKTKSDLRIGLEAGMAYGISASESLADNDDSAVYVGLTVDIGL
ncbi:MAG: hypothetical protein AAF937_02300 [Planctomycetota bacterium]